MSNSVAIGDAWGALRGDSTLGRVEAAIMGESALIDRETGRVFWEGGGSSTLVESVFAAKLDKFGAEHAQSVLLTAFVTVAFLGILAGWLRQIIQVPSSSGDDDASSRLARLLYFLFSNTLSRIPRFKNKWLVAATVALYFLESYNCDTRRFLANALSSPAGVEHYIEQLRSQQPVVTWMVRSFHYRRRKIFAVGEMLHSMLRTLRSPDDVRFPTTTPSKKCAPAFPFTKKVVTNEARRAYQFQTVVDNTTAGLWRRSPAISSDMAPFTRIVLNKLLVLKDSKTREDYFRQQIEFVTEHGRGDEFTEFSTDIQGAFDTRCGVHHHECTIVF
jgi:hypothetical protein